MDERIDDNEVLFRLFSTLETANQGEREEGKIGSDNSPSVFGPLAVRSTLNLALFVALADADPLVGYNWLANNRLSLLSIPGFKCGIFETISKISNEGEGFLDFSSNEIRMLKLLANKLEVLKD